MFTTFYFAYQAHNYVHSSADPKARGLGTFKAAIAKEVADV
jgi:hypothetical protein